MNHTKRQFRYETEGWKRLLEFIKNENALTRHHLADFIGRSNGSEEMLSVAENYLHNLQQIEIMTALLRNDVIHFEGMVEKHPADDQLPDSAIADKRKSLQKDVDRLQSEFRSIKWKMDNFLSETTEK